MQEIVAGSLYQHPIKGKYTFYKRVNKITKGKYSSCYDKNFIYQDGKISEVKNPEMNTTISCGTGIHVSTPYYWDEGDTLIAVQVDVKDVITCLQGKIRCQKVKVIGEVTI